MLSWRRQVALVAGLAVVATALVLGGSALLASAARTVLGDRPVVHLLAGAVWTTVAVGLLVDPEWMPPARRRLAARSGWSMLAVAWLFAPLSRFPTGNRGAGEDLPWLSAGLLLALPLAYLGWRAVHAPARRRRRAAREDADRAGREASDHRSYRSLLARHDGNVAATDDAFRRAHLQHGARLPHRPPEIEEPDRSEQRHDTRGNRLPRRTVLRRRR